MMMPTHEALLQLQMQATFPSLANLSPPPPPLYRPPSPHDSIESGPFLIITEITSKSLKPVTSGRRTDISRKDFTRDFSII